MRTRESKPYQQIAGFYDELMDHVDYELWADYIREVWFRHAPGLYHSVYDAACGTGRFLVHMKEQGVPRYGSDKSQPMLDIALRRLNGHGVLLSCQDLRELREPRKHSLVTCLYDAVNYLLDPQDLLRGLKSLARITDPEGLMVFDVCTERNSLDHFLDFHDEGHAGSWDYHRHSWYDQESRTHHNEFRVASRHSKEEYYEHHRQRIYSLKELEHLLERAGLNVLGCYREYSFDRGSERADRVHFVTQPDLSNA